MDRKRLHPSTEKEMETTKRPVGRPRMRTNPSVHNQFGYGMVPSTSSQSGQQPIPGMVNDSMEQWRETEARMGKAGMFPYGFSHYGCHPHQHAALVRDEYEKLQIYQDTKSMKMEIERMKEQQIPLDQDIEKDEKEMEEEEIKKKAIKAAEDEAIAEGIKKEENKLERSQKKKIVVEKRMTDSETANRQLEQVQREVLEKLEELSSLEKEPGDRDLVKELKERYERILTGLIDSEEHQNKDEYKTTKEVKFDQEGENEEAEESHSVEQS